MPKRDQSPATTVLFTDIVESTQLMQREGDESAQRIFRTHRQMLGDAVRKHGGREVKWLGDGLMAAFTSTAAALRCAVDIQQTARRPGVILERSSRRPALFRRKVGDGWSMIDRWLPSTVHRPPSTFAMQRRRVIVSPTSRTLRTTWRST